MRPLKLPITICTPELIDIPRNENVLEMMERRKSANLVEGYKLFNKFEEPQLHSFYAEINIDNDRLWILLKTLIAQFPDEVALIYQHIDDEDPKYGDYVDKYELLNFLTEYQQELIQDGYFHFGIINNTETSLQEVFVHRTKYLQVWGMDEEQFRKTMTSFDIYEVDELNFIDEYPVQTTVLSSLYSNVKQTDELLDEFESKFGNERLL